MQRTNRGCPNPVQNSYILTLPSVGHNANYYIKVSRKALNLVRYFNAKLFSCQTCCTVVNSAIYYDSLQEETHVLDQNCVLVFIIKRIWIEIQGKKTWSGYPFSCVYLLLSDPKISHYCSFSRFSLWSAMLNVILAFSPLPTVISSKTSSQF